jgi:hypothetical protein
VQFCKEEFLFHTNLFYRKTFITKFENNIYIHIFYPICYPRTGCGLVKNGPFVEVSSRRSVEQTLLRKHPDGTYVANCYDMPGAAIKRRTLYCKDVHFTWNTTNALNCRHREAYSMSPVLTIQQFFSVRIWILLLYLIWIRMRILLYECQKHGYISFQFRHCC